MIGSYPEWIRGLSGSYVTFASMQNVLEDKIEES